MNEEPTDFSYVVHDMTRPDHENPAFGPMSEREARQFEQRNSNYWAQHVSKVKWY